MLWCLREAVADAAKLIVRRDVEPQITPAAIGELEGLHLSDATVTAHDYAIRVEDLSTAEAEKEAWRIEMPGLIIWIVVGSRECYLPPRQLHNPAVPRMGFPRE